MALPDIFAQSGKTPKPTATTVAAKAPATATTVAAKAPANTATTTISQLPENIQRTINANAASQGLTGQQYLESRGGVNPVTGFYGDAANAKLLTDAEYLAAKSGTSGVGSGIALNKAYAKKTFDNAIAAIPPKGQSETDAAYNARVDAAKAQAQKDYDTALSNQQAALSGGTTPGTTPGTTTPGDLNTGMTTGKIDAIAAISALLSSYGIGDLSASITAAVVKGYTSDTIQLIMQDPNSSDPLAVAFQTRFPANKARVAAGKAVLSASEYLAAERTYSQVLQSYGLSGQATRSNFNTFITNDISASEVSDRVSLAINRVQNADPETKKMLTEYYPMLNQSDIVGAMLNPKDALPALQRKIQISEIGGAALTQGLKTNVDAQTGLQTGYEGVTSGALGAQDLANLGITKEQARTGYQNVAEIAPRAEFLSSITGGEDYTRLQAEQEVFQGLASAKRARVNLTQSEVARFGGATGMSKTSLNKGNKGSF